jgi:hypothetical protein
MSRIPIDSFLDFCKSLDGQDVCTIKRHTKFKVKVVGQDLEFTPLVTGKSRPHKKEYVRGVLDMFNDSQSFMPRDYKHYTVNASYQLALIQGYIKSRGAA